jgi:LysM repeat protein
MTSIDAKAAAREYRWNGNPQRIVVGKPPAAPRHLEAPGTKPSGEPAKAAASPAKSPRATTVTVKSGDTLYTIAQRHGVTVASLKSVNRLDSDRLHAGQSLVVARAKP